LTLTNVHDVGVKRRKQETEAPAVPEPKPDKTKKVSKTTIS
jgi:hypothetical protein